MEGRAENSRAANHSGSVFLVTSAPSITSLEQQKDTPDTQEILKDLGAQCQEPGAEPNVYFSIISHKSIWLNIY